MRSADDTGQPGILDRDRESTVLGHVREHFETRARALSHARLALMAVGLGVLVVPAWRRALSMPLPLGTCWHTAILFYQVISFPWVGRRHARAVVFVSLCFDLLPVLYLVAAGGGLHSPLLPAQLGLTPPPGGDPVATPVAPAIPTVYI